MQTGTGRLIFMGHRVASVRHRRAFGPRARAAAAGPRRHGEPPWPWPGGAGGSALRSLRRDGTWWWTATHPTPTLQTAPIRTLRPVLNALPPCRPCPPACSCARPCTTVIAVQRCSDRCSIAKTNSGVSEVASRIR